jgi:hypothetical protein
MAPIKRALRKPKYTPQDVAAGTKHEMEHTRGVPKSRKRSVAKKIATDHLKEHPTYYRVLPMAENLMSLQENKPPGKPKKKRKPAQQSSVLTSMHWVPKIQTPRF